MINDWPGTRFHTTHRCFGSPCESDIEKYALVQLQDNNLPHAYGDFHNERDIDAGYPKEYTANKDMVKMIKAHIQGETGAFITPFDVQNKIEEEEERKLNEAAKKPAFKVTDRMIDDWPGTRFTTTHACFGRPCEKDLLAVDDIKTGTFRVGDMQEHKYKNQRAWKPNAMPHSETEPIENVHKIVSRYWDPSTNRLRHPIELEHAKAEAEDKNNAPARWTGETYHVPDDIINDWTGQKWVDAAFKDKEDKKTKKSLVQLQEDNLVQLDSNVESLVDAELDTEPFDPNLADTEKIMKRYEMEDAEKELNAKRMQIGNDPNGGIDKISAGEITHRSHDDDEKLKTLLRKYTTTIRDSEYAPTGERKLEKWGAMLACEEAIRSWNEISDPALEKFMKENFETTWNKYDMLTKGSIDFDNSVAFVRELMQSRSPKVLSEVEPTVITPA